MYFSCSLSLPPPVAALLVGFSGGAAALDLVPAVAAVDERRSFMRSART